jgi:putative methyltransferase (TIGR04325 family)
MKITLKKIIKAFVPYGLLYLFKVFKEQKKLEEQKKLVEYKTYNEALKNCNNGYENHELCKMVADKTIIYKNNLLQKPYFMNATNAFIVSAIYQYSKQFSKNEINVLDLGGACGVHYFETKLFTHENIKLYWNIIETQEMVRSAKEHNLENNELHFFDDFSELSTPIDFVYSSGTLQSVPDAYEYLAKLIELKANYILFNRMMFNEDDRDFITVQLSKLSANGPGKMPEGYEDKIIKYPHTTLSYKKFNEKLEKQYKLEWTFDERSGIIYFNNEKIIGKGLLYKKRV